jgi:tRNA (adenine57-N1/adenine58-N1)-methyltransferase catalytic subunit
MAPESGSTGVLSQEIKLGDRVLLYQDARRKWIAKVEPGRFHTHRGYFELAELVDKEWGGSIRTSMGQNLAVFKPRALDIVESFDRPTQILYPKDIGYALFQLGIGNGDRVLEVGTGSGALTSALARGIAPDGQVFTYEMRPEFLRAAKANIEKAGFGSLVTFHNKDPTEGFDEKDADAVVVDLGDPWKMVGAAWRALIGGGLLAGFTPTINQLEKLAVALREGGFAILEAVELLMREFKTEAGKVRPETRMIGHTAYVTIARKLLAAPDT